MNKDSKEFNNFLALLVNGGYKDAGDGNFNPAKDFQEYIPALFAAQPAFNGLNNYKGEMETMGISEKVENQLALSEGMSDLPDLDRYDLANGIHGLECLFSIIARKSYEKGLRDGAERASR